MPFGMMNSAATFNRVVRKVLADHHAFSDSFIDDIIIFSETWENHLEHIKVVLGALHCAGLTVNPRKCEFGSKQIEFLGHLIGNSQELPTPEKVQAILNIPVPVKKKKVRSFLGSINFYRTFIPNFSTKSAPLSDMTKKNQPNKVNHSGNFLPF